MKRILIAGMVALAMLAACESGPTIRANTDPSANLSSYRTYTFAGTDRARTARAIRRRSPATSRKRSGARWMRGDSSSSKAARPTCSSTSTPMRARTSTSARRPAPRMAAITAIAAGMYGGFYGAAAVAPEVQTVRYKVGTANVDVVDMTEEAARLGRHRRSDA